jgi:hypothetical protein
MKRSGRVYAGALAGFDERRNTSRVRPVTPGSAEKVLEHLAGLRDEEWYRWIVDEWRLRRIGERSPGTLAAEHERSSSRSSSRTSL